MPQTPTPEDAARHLLHMMVGHFHAMPGRVLREANLLQIFPCDGWDALEYNTGRTYAVEHGWLAAAMDTLTLTNAGYATAFT